MQETILNVNDLRVYYHTPTGPVKAVDGVTFTLHKGERFGLVGESGSGKSTAAFGILRLTKAPAHIESGEVFLDGEDLLKMTPATIKRKRFADISLIPQGAMNSLNPVLRIREQLTDVIKEHEKGISAKALDERAGRLLEMVGLKRAVIDRYPHELSGGMKQRVCIAMAIALEPKVIIADEPTSALDVVTQRQVMETLSRVQDEINASVILVGHDMGLMAQFVDTIGVMYAGRLAEVGPVKAIFAEPLHPYTRMLISSLPSLEKRGVFQGIPGIAPSLRNLAPGCHFHPRCPDTMPHCLAVGPQLVEVRPSRWVACHLYNAMIMPLSSFGGMLAYKDTIQDLIDQYQVDNLNLTKVEELMTGAGYVKDGEGFWADSAGNRVIMTISTTGGRRPMGPPLAQQLRDAGFDAITKHDETGQIVNGIRDGSETAWIEPHCGAAQEPFPTFSHFHSKFSAPIGEVTGYRWANSRYENPEYDAILDAMEAMSPSVDDPAYVELWHQAADIWLRDLPEIVLAEERHVWTFNARCWSGWPNEDDPYVAPYDVWGAFLKTVLNLKSTGAC